MNQILKRRKRLIIVSNRLPFSVSTKEGRLTYRESAGGLVTGLSGYLDTLKGESADTMEYVWVGWPGTTIERGQQVDVRTAAGDHFHSAPVFLAEEEMDLFYHGFCNKTIWPLFHYFPSLVEYRDDFWHRYREVNERFSDELAGIVKEDDLVWVHDYQLMLLPRLLRNKRPGATIGFFLHIPFPSYEVFRLLPAKWRVDLLDGLLGADLIGFHTYEYARHYLQSALRILGHEPHMGQIVTSDRIVKVETFPLGIDFDKFSTAMTTDSIRAERNKLASVFSGVRVILSVDRLDYTKGILNRLQAFEVLLQKHPEYCGNVVLVMVVVPSRTGVAQYAMMKKQIEELVGNINGLFGRVGWTPVVYQYKQLPFNQLAALYGISDVCLVTPLRDGMNLVAKEYVASRADRTGVLILSEMAGAVKELAESVIINPNNRDEIADAMHEALQIPNSEQQRRMEIMRGRLQRYTAKRWAEDFVGQLTDVKSMQERFSSKILDKSARQEIVVRFKRAKRRLILLDYDGTLVPLQRHPDLARPGEEVIELLKDLCVDHRNTVVVVSGRDRGTLNQWLGGLPIGLAAEHGAWLKERGGEWQTMKAFESEWKSRIHPILQQYADRVPGSFVEGKDYSIAWHYRNADPDQAQAVAAELTDNLMTFMANIDVHVLQGNKIVEVRNAGVDKGNAARTWIARGEFDFILAIGDDWTDEDLFDALPRNALSIRVGMTHTKARHNIRDQREVAPLLETLAALRSSPEPALRQMK